MNTCIIYWLDGKKTEIKGKDEIDAFSRAGYGGGAIRAIDFISKESSREYVWDDEERRWKIKSICKCGKKVYGEFDLCIDCDF